MILFINGKYLQFDIRFDSHTLNHFITFFRNFSWISLSKTHSEGTFDIFVKLFFNLFQTYHFLFLSYLVKLHGIIMKSLDFNIKYFITRHKYHWTGKNKGIYVFQAQGKNCVLACALKHMNLKTIHSLIIFRFEKPLSKEL